MPSPRPSNARRAPQLSCPVCFTGERCQVLCRAAAPTEAGRAGCRGGTKLSSSSLGHCCQLCSATGPAAPLRHTFGDARSGSRGVHGAGDPPQTAPAEPTAREVYCSSLKEDEKLQGGLLMCQEPSNGKIPNQQGLVCKHSNPSPGSAADAWLCSGAEQWHGAGVSRSSPCARNEGTGWESARGTSRVSSGGSAGSI